MQRAGTFLGWYVHRDGKLAGPLSTEEVGRLLAGGGLNANEEILKAWRDDSGRTRFYGGQARAALAERPRSEPAGDGASLRVLIVDDCKDGADSLATLMRMWRHEVQVAYDGPSALVTAGRFRPQVILLDIALPGMDGYCLAQQLRGQAEFHNARFIAVSGYADEAHRALGEEAGFDDYLVKPVDPNLLQDLLAQKRWGQRPSGELS
jgi:CheY-like chemotaxis protein